MFGNTRHAHKTDVYYKDMYYYFVWVRSARYHGQEPLTYASNEKLEVGTIVDVELQKASVIGFVSGQTTKPRFKTKEILSTYELPAIPSHLIRLARWILVYYPAPIGIISQQLLPAAFTQKQMTAKDKLNILPPKLDLLPELTPDQSAAIETMSVRDTFLLHGKTGSGKTRLYMELARINIDKGRSSIILTPEISLTSQLADNFTRIFGERVIIMHSKQTPAQRRKAWLDCLRAAEPVIVIGPRSALFAPIQKLGLVVLDEEHEAAYKQEQSPQYHSGRVASYLTNMIKATLIFGSATPLVTDYYLAKEKEKPIIRLDKLAQQNSKAKTEIVVVDHKDHGLFSSSNYLSQPLIESIGQALSRNEQILLYLNRRGTARMVMCEKCGWQATCPNCDVPLTYHGDLHQLRCHSCDFSAPVPSSCPECHYASVVFKTAGTKAIVDDVKKHFAHASVSRFDTDNLRNETFEQKYFDARDGKIDILVGTQMLAKGLDLPKLSTVGILLADTSLYLPDFTAQERTYQLINQVIGRIGRGHIAGRAVIQTYHPDHPILKYAVEDDYQTFYNQELESRKKYLFPPFCYMLKIKIRRATSKGAESTALRIKDELTSSGYRLKIEGPAPSFYEKQLGKYQWQLVVKANQRNELIRVIADLPANVQYDIDPIDLL
ncbi:MAG TPA: primosomal protein N' [Candidatus Saccharimonadales bacterium]|nr:primosomal protein N' [Candidatus Saccharimonadales bacterium]